MTLALIFIAIVFFIGFCSDRKIEEWQPPDKR